MKSTKFRQCVCISETSAEAFQDAANEALARLAEPEIVVDRSKPFTMYVFYNMHRNTPETFLELLEMLDDGGGRAKCEDCPAFIRSKDRRRKWGKCRRKETDTRLDSRACESYYLERRREAERMAEEFESIPFVSE